ncbi:hypothetical protein KJ969_02435 [Patescibacteria group bacterium]|nr:hypothetical protein [Patescibacteria group bacterium]MBU1921644.1 hypothetical protein [Patescibacteria group bacterium]
MLKIISDFVWGGILIVLAVISFAVDEITYGVVCLVVGVILLYWFGYRGLQKRKAAKPNDTDAQK